MSPFRTVADDVTIIRNHLPTRRSLVLFLRNARIYSLEALPRGVTHAKTTKWKLLREEIAQIGGTLAETSLPAFTRSEQQRRTTLTLRLRAEPAEPTPIVRPFALEKYLA